MNFSPWIFWRLSLSKSDSSCQKLGLDKRKLKTIDKHASTCQKTKKLPHIVSADHRSKFAAVLKNIAWWFAPNRLCKPCETEIVEHCAQRKDPRGFSGLRWLRNGSQQQISSVFDCSPPHVKFRLARTFRHVFSGSSPFQNLIPHVKNWGWTKGN